MIVKDMQTSLRGITNRAWKEKDARFRQLYGLLNETNLRWCFYQLRKKAAPGVDRVTFVEYERNLDDNLADLVERLKGKRYRAKLVRRKYIPKGRDKFRPLGIPALEDKLLQLGAAKILSAIYEVDFLDMSWGYRPGRGPRDASRHLEDTLFRGKYNWVVESDIRGFFDEIDHDWMERMLEERVDDRAFISLIKKWLKAGVLEEDGKILHPATGSPQGGIVSPILANIYLHYALDLWFDRKVRKQCRGDAHIIRFADDFACAFQYRDDAERFEQELSVRLGKFNLEVAPEKTRLLKFSRYEREPNEAFEFLGFEFRWVRGRAGKPKVRRQTAPGRLRRAIATFKEWIISNRDKRIKLLMKMLRSKLLGYWNYYGVQGNSDGVNHFWFQAIRLLWKWLNRRSQKRSFTLEKFYALLERHRIPPPRIVERSHNQRQLSFC